MTRDDHPWLDGFAPRLTTINLPMRDRAPRRGAAGRSNRAAGRRETQWREGHHAQDGLPDQVMRVRTSFAPMRRPRRSRGPAHGAGTGVALLRRRTPKVQSAYTRQFTACEVRRSPHDAYQTPETMAQALVEFSAQQHTSLDADRAAVLRRSLRNLWSRNVAGVGQALLEAKRSAALLPAPERARRWSIPRSASRKWRIGAGRWPAPSLQSGPGATNMLTGAAVCDDQTDCPCCSCRETSSRTRGPAPVLQQLERQGLAGRFRERLLQAGLEILGSINRPEQLITALPDGAAHVPDVPGLAKPAPSRSALPQDVQAEAFDYPE